MPTALHRRPTSLPCTPLLVGTHSPQRQVCAGVYCPRMLLVTEHIQTGPRTVLLQILLNRLGADLKVDGLFGRKTKASVEKFESLKHLTPDGKAGPAVWRQLFQHNKERVVDIVDVGDPLLQK